MSLTSFPATLQARARHAVSDVGIEWNWRRK